MSEKASNEAQERLRAWRENCLSCRHLRENRVEPHCTAGGGWVVVNSFPLALVLSDIAKAGYWASNGMHLDVSWLPVAASCMPSCTHYERALQ